MMVVWGKRREAGDVQICVTKKTNIQSKEDERFISLLAAAGYTRWSVEVARVLVVVLGGEDKGSQPAN
jgi:hypothetical protein